MTGIRTSGFTFGDDEDNIRFRYKTLNSFMVIAAIFAFLFALLHDLGINYISDTHAKADYFYAGSSVFLLLLLRHSRSYYTAVASAFLIISYATFISALLFVVSDEFRIVWFFLVVYATYMLLGAWPGLLMTVASIAGIAICAAMVDLHLSDTALYTGVIGLLIASLLNLTYTMQIVRYETQLEEKNRALKQSVADLDQALVQTEQANQAKSLFLANMSHEIRTPMNGVLGMVQVMQGTELNEAQQHYLETIERSGSNLLLLIDELLDLSRIEAGSLEIKAVPFETFHWVIDIQILAEPLFEGDEVSFITEVSDELPARLRGDAARLTQMVINLLNNAAKFTDRGEVRLTIGGAPAGNGHYRMKIEVSDTGIGIPPSKLNEVFDVFQQVAPGRCDNRGVGLGLNITRRLADAMGGTVEVSSTEGRGSRFTIEVELPIVTEAATVADRSMPVLKRALRVLLVDDDAINRLVIHRLFTQQGHVVVEAVNGTAALDLLSGQMFDVVLMDVHMPVMDGIEATRRIRALDNPLLAQLPIIGLTASVMKDERQDYLAAGMNAVVQKPVVFEALLQTIAEATSLGTP